jgi:hypothetical protein
VIPHVDLIRGSDALAVGIMSLALDLFAWDIRSEKTDLIQSCFEASANPKIFPLIIDILTPLLCLIYRHSAIIRATLIGDFLPLFVSAYSMRSSSKNYSHSMRILTCFLSAVQTSDGDGSEKLQNCRRQCSQLITKLFQVSTFYLYSIFLMKIH